MSLKYLVALSTLGLGACASVVSETSSAIVVDGNSYEVRTRMIDGARGPSEQTSVVVRNKLYTCLPDSPGDCEAAVRGARDERNRRG